MALRTPGIQQRQLDIFERARARQQIEALEHEADLRVPHPRQLGACRARDTTLPFRKYLPAARAMRQPSRCMNVDLPDPDGPVSATNSAGMDIERDATERMHLQIARRLALAASSSAPTRL